MDQSFFELVDEFGLRLKLLDAQLANDTVEVRRLEEILKDIRSGESLPPGELSSQNWPLRHPG